MPLSDVYPFGKPLDRVRTYDGEAPFAQHTHIYLDKSGPDDAPRRTPSLPAADRAVLRRIRDAAIIGAEPDPIKRRKPLAKDQDPDEKPRTGDPKVVAKLPPPPEGMHYEVESRPEGVWAVLVSEGPPRGYYDLPSEDRRVHRLSYPDGDPLLKKMNRDARRLWSGKTGDAEQQRKTLFVHHPSPDERLVLEGPDDLGAYQLVLITNTSDLTANTPLGGSGDGPVLRSKGAVPPSRTIGDRRSTTRQRLAAMNISNRRFWGRGR